MIPIARHRLILKARKPADHGHDLPAGGSLWRDIRYQVIILGGFVLLALAVVAVRVALTWQG
jgi:hypothetical protein